MKRIESESNPRIRRAKRIRTGQKDSFILVEGEKLFQEALESDIRFEEVFVTPQAWNKYRASLQNLETKGVEVLLIGTSLMKSISSVQTPQGILGIAGRITASDTVKELHRFGSFLFSVRDPGNLGTIIRTAEASGCEYLAYTNDCVDPFGPKVIRASMGSIFRVPLIEVHKPREHLAQMSRQGVHLYGLYPRGRKNLFLLRPKFPALILIGSESHGLPEDLPFNEEVSIPMAGRVESLNVAMATALCFYRFSLHSSSEGET